MGLAEEWLEARAESKASHKRFKDLEEKLIAELGGKSRDLTVDGTAYTLTPVVATRVTWDKPAVIELLTPAQRKRLTVAELDVEAFTAALKSKELDFKLFGPLKTVAPGAAYVRPTAK